MSGFTARGPRRGWPHTHREQQPDDALAMSAPWRQVTTHDLVTAFVGRHPPCITGEGVVDHRRQTVVTQHDRVRVAVRCGDHRRGGPHPESGQRRQPSPGIDRTHRGGFLQSVRPAGGQQDRVGAASFDVEAMKLDVCLRRDHLGGRRKAEVTRPRCRLTPLANDPRPALDRLFGGDPLAEHHQEQLLPDHAGSRKPDARVPPRPVGDLRVQRRVEAIEVVVQANPVRGTIEEPLCAAPPRLGRGQAISVPGEAHRADALRCQHRFGETVRRPTGGGISSVHPDGLHRGPQVDVAGPHDSTPAAV